MPRTLSGDGIGTVLPARVNADTVATFEFPNDTAQIQGPTRLSVQARIHRGDFQGSFAFTNDHSYGAGQTLTMPWPNITAYVDSQLVWGTEPPLAAQ
jgi:uncharacterized lipoprotein YbaY